MIDLPSIPPSSASYARGPSPAAFIGCDNHGVAIRCEYIYARYIVYVRGIYIYWLRYVLIYMCIHVYTYTQLLIMCVVWWWYVRRVVYITHLSWHAINRRTRQL